MITVLFSQTVEIAGQGAYLAHVDENGDVVIYPQGRGQGPMIAMSKQDWARISREVMLAYMRAERTVGKHD